MSKLVITTITLVLCTPTNAYAACNRHVKPESGILELSKESDIVLTAKVYTLRNNTIGDRTLLRSSKVYKGAFKHEYILSTTQPGMVVTSQVTRIFVEDVTEVTIGLKQKAGALYISECNLLP